jgi:hypothetical protein
VLFVLLCAAALPLAYSNEEAFGVREVTHDYELGAMRWASEHGVEAVATDQRFGDIIDPYFDVQADKTGPWSLKTGTLAEGDVVLASMDWTGPGAQMYPFGSVVFTEDGLDAWMGTCDVCYAGGPEGSEMVIAIVR